MKNQDHKSTADDGKAKARPRIKAASQVAHPILQLQQIVGNKAVTKMIQRHPEDSSKIANHETKHNKDIHWTYKYTNNLWEFVGGINNRVYALEQSSGKE